MKRHGINPTPDCLLFSEFVPDFASLEQISLPSAHTVLLIVADTHDVPTEIIARVAQRFLASGLIYICAWGPDCRRVHDIFDEVYVGDGSSEPTFMLMSTWHSDESIEEAILFFIQCAFTLGAEMETASYVATTVGDTNWAAVVDRALSDLPSFISRMLQDEDKPIGNA